MTVDQITDPLQLSIAQIGATQNIEANLNRVIRRVTEAASTGSQLIVFPECILTGYMYDNLEDVQDHSIRLDGPEIRMLANACRDQCINAVVGLLEDQGPGNVKNSAVYISDAGTVDACYRKVHLPCLGADRFVTEGDSSAPIVDTRFGRIAINICYDLRFPECARVAALAGADLIAQPSTMPLEASELLEHFVPVRAAENRVYLALANRPDEEGGVPFIGRSQVVDPSGRRVVEAPKAESCIVTESVQLYKARDKQIVNIPGRYEVSLFADRRPRRYASIADLGESDGR